MTPEAKAARAAKIRAGITPELRAARSAQMTIYNALATPERRSANWQPPSAAPPDPVDDPIL
jgi:hypothetical protein